VAEHEGDVVGALFACPDESPVAWVRLAALEDGWDSDAWLNVTLPPILDRLRSRGARTLAWMDCEGWAGSHLGARGFRPLAEVITLTKSDRALPDAGKVGVSLRSASDVDAPAVVAVDRAAFTPHWWRGEATVCRRIVVSSRFTVSEAADAVVGYADGELCLPAAHLNRIAVHPDHQGHGVGTLLLRDALCAFWEQGAERVALNTQAGNRRSRRLYRRFGFEPTGDVMTAWELQL